MRTVFLGSGEFALPILEVVAVHPSTDLVGVVSAPDRSAGRGHRARAVPVATLARERGWPLLQPMRLRDPDASASVLELGPGLLVLADYGQIVPASLLGTPPGALNVHPSLLPRHRGASPVPATILAGDRETGVTVIRMDTGVDSGPIVAQERVPLGGHETAPELERQLATVGARVLAGVLEAWLAGAIEARPQPEEGATVTRPLHRVDGRIDWTRPATAIERQVRAYQPWPGSFTDTSVGTLTVWSAQAGEGDAGKGDTGAGAAGPPPGTVIPLDGGIAVVTGAGTLELLEAQLAGRRRMSGRELRNGYRGLIGTRLD